MILIRADANEHIGTGHVMRCLSIANAFVRQGEHVEFITADHKSDRLIQQAGFTSICLNSDWTRMEAEILALRQQIERSNPSFLIVDSYRVTGRYFRELKKYSRIAYIDDLNLYCWDIDVLINYNVFATLFDYTGYKDSGSKLLLGPEFAPLRDEFRNAPKHMIRETVTDIMVSAGGADPEGITEKLLTYVCPRWPVVKFHFIVGALNPRQDRIRGLAGDNVVLHINERHMSKLMSECDIAVSAAGSTLYELCAIGVPTITYTMADNQKVATEQFEEKEIMIGAGDCRSNNEFIDRVERQLRKLAGNAALREELSQRMQNLVDGDGAERIVKILGDSHE